MPTNREQYHHFIPRFVLRRYMLPTDPPKDKSGKRRKPGPEQETIHYFNIEARELEVQPLGKVYGVANLYRDVKNIENANHLEKELSRLECAAASVIKTIHDNLGRREFQINRKKLESLRKFLFIMFYRKPALSSSYYDENHPENGPLGEWLKHVKKKNALDSQADVWLYFLEFFLTTPHQSLISRAVRAMKTHGIAVIIPSKLPESAMNDYATIDYSGLTGASFLGIVEAADESEFLMSNNSFGLWEGLMLGMPGVHRLFIISPRAALLLRLNACRTELFGSMHPINSDLINIQIEPPQVEYPGGRAALTEEELTKHRLSSNSQNDRYHFRIVKLTREQTQAVNNVVLLNAKENGSITFLTRATMFKTLQDYCKTMDAMLFMSNNLKNSYSVFMTKLTADDQPKEANSNVKVQHTSVDKDISKEHTELAISAITIPLDELHLHSDYSQAYQRYSTASMDEPAGQYIFDTTDFLAEQFRDLPLLDVIGASQGGSRARTDPFANLVDTLPEADGRFVLARMKALLAKVEVKKWNDATLSEELYEAAIVGLLEWLVKNKGDVLQSLFPNVVLTKS